MNGKADESSSVAPKAVQPETDFAEFFRGVISELYDMKNRQILNDVKTALRDIRLLKSEIVDIHKRVYFSFKPPSVRCAYLYAYSVLHSNMVYYEFSNLLKQSKMFLVPACRRGSLKICCLGGGAGIEAVAICRSINDTIMGLYMDSLNSLLEVHVTVIDKLPHWKREISAMVKAINDSSNVLHFERISFHFEFIKADLLKPFEKDLQEKIMEADVVTIVKVLVSIEMNSPESCEGEIQLMMKNVTENMREDSCLFVLDASGGQVVNNLSFFLKSEGDHSRLKTSKHKNYKLEMKTVKKYEEMMKLKKDLTFRPVLPTFIGKVSACMWVKNITLFPDFKSLIRKKNVSNKKKSGKISNVANPICPTVQSIKDSSSPLNSGTEPATPCQDVMITSDVPQNIEPEKKSKRALKKEMKRKIKKKL